MGNFKKMCWPMIFRLILIIDSAVFLLKSSVPIYMIVFGIKEKAVYDQLEKSDSSHLNTMILTFLFLGASIELILISVRFYTNWSQHRNEKFEDNSADNGKNYCCSTSCWFVVSMFHIAINAALIVLDWTEGRWLSMVVISFITWEIFFFCFMVTFKVLFCTVFVAKRKTVETENGIPTEQPKVVQI
ncbi:uncharacterized protein LOC119066859 [Bradysia coprophila]|uniref:uncharacterized protein LOC119066859 n=1 Tax=Bradysia coprophila TaxID=38358 RepID=UPI00187DD4D5|nr:uncharacterized protein LOC119066859 [Bradysia coprophila]